VTAARGRVARLAAEAAEAAQVRALTTDPDVIAYRVEKVRTQVDALLWAGIVLGLAFTMVNVQSFAADGSPVGSMAWWVAWLLDPMVSVVLLAVLRAEQVTARYQVALPPWGRRTKWLTFAATYVMNTWTSWGLSEEPLSWSGVILHSVPPLVVFATAETGPGLRDKLTEAVGKPLTEHPATEPTPTTETTTAPEATTAMETTTAPAVEAEIPAAVTVHEPLTTPVHEPLTNRAPAQRTTPPTTPRTAGRRTARGKRPAPRRLLPDFITQARAALDTARADGAPAEPTATWCREVTGCSAGTSVKVAAALHTPTPAPVLADREAA